MPARVTYLGGAPLHLDKPPSDDRARPPSNGQKKVSLVATKSLNQDSPPSLSFWERCVGCCLRCVPEHEPDFACYDAI